MIMFTELIQPRYTLRRMNQLGDKYNTKSGRLSYRIGFHYGLMGQQSTRIVCEEHCLCWTIKCNVVWVDLCWFECKTGVTVRTM